jgi:hypothetical protein
MNMTLDDFYEFLNNEGPEAFWRWLDLYATAFDIECVWDQVDERRDVLSSRERFDDLHDCERSELVRSWLSSSCSVSEVEEFLTECSHTALSSSAPSRASIVAVLNHLDAISQLSPYYKNIVEEGLKDRSLSK